MDDFEYSLHISDQDWDSFFQECEGCNLLSPGLASREDSGMSDIDEMGCHFLDMNRLSNATSTEPDLQIDGPPDCEGSPVDSYLSKYGIRSPEQVLSGSEEDLHLQTVNLFFEQLKSVTENEQPLEQSRVANCRSEKMDHLDGFTDKQVICPSGRNESNPKGEITKQGEADTWGSTALEEGTIPTSTNAQVNTSASTAKELVIGEESFSLKLITVGVKQEQQEKRCDLSTDLKLKPETKPPDKHKMPPVVAANGIDMTDSKPAKENIAQLDPGSSSDSKDSQVNQIPVSPSNLRRKRRKKKKMSIEAGEPGPGYEAQFRVLQSESEEERFIQREEINSFPTNVKKTERPSLPRFKISPMPHNSKNLKLNFTFAPVDLKCSKSLPVSFTTFGSGISIHNISKSMNDMPLVNNGQLKAEVCPKSILPQIDKVLHLQESDTGLNIIKSDTDCSPAQSKTSMRKTLSEPVSDHSAAGCQRKSLLSPNISSAADSTEPLSSFNLTEDTYKDVSCLGNENDCCALKSEENLPGKWNMTMNLDFQQSGSSLTENIDELKFSLDGNSPQIFSQFTLQKGKTDTVDVSGCKTFKISKDSPLSKTNIETECHMPESTFVSDYRKDEDHIKNMNNSSEEINANASIMNPGNLTASSEDKKDIVNEDDRRDESNDKHLLGDKTTGSNEHIHGHKEEDEMVNEKSTENVLADASEMNPAIVAERFSCSPEFSNVSNDPESIVLDTPGPVRSPVYAISSFWNEMEKLTINDILRLRMISNAQHPSVLTQPEDGSVADTTDAADSGYFTQPDDSKPDRLSGDMSFISDLDEDLAQLQTQYSSKLDDESCEFPSRSCSVTWENDSDPVIMGDDVVYIGSETTPEHVYATNTQQCFRKMCKNISVQNLQALESQPIRQMPRNASLQSIHSEVEDHFYHVNTSHQTCLSDDEDVEGGGITFSEIIQYFFADAEPERCSSRADNNAAASCLDETGTSVPEMYDHFFSEFDSESFFNPFEDEPGGNDKTIPIFSCTRSVNRNLQFPEAYDYFFPDSPVNSDEDDENDNAPIKMLTRYDHTSSNHYSVATTDMYEYFYPDDTFQSNPLSLIQRTGPADPEEKSSSWAVTRVKPFHKGIQSITVMGPDDKPFPDTLYLNLENRIFQRLAEQQRKCMEMQTVVADPRLDAPFLPLRQADMCLVCIAFASWVLKSASPGADTWKAALLANISALSAIRYLRRHKREEVSGKTPLRQIEPA